MSWTGGNSIIVLSNLYYLTRRPSILAYTDQADNCRKGELCDAGSDESSDHFFKECIVIRRIREKFEMDEMQISKILVSLEENEEIKEIK